MATPLPDALAALKAARDQYGDAVLVAFSGGKDSLAVLDLCLRTFTRVEAFLMEFLPGLECYGKAVAFAEARGVKLHRLMHWGTGKLLADGVYCDPIELPKLRAEDVWNRARAVSGIDLVATGSRKSDNMWRRCATAGGVADTAKLRAVYPLKSWNKRDVEAFLHGRGIPIPRGAGSGNSSGVDLGIESLCWLHDCWPRDFARVLEVFPYAQAVIRRRELFGVGPSFAA